MFVAYRYPEVDSTQQRAKQLLDQGEEAGIVVVAEEQQAGRGRLHRQWLSPRGGLYFSLVVHPENLLSLRAGVAVATALRDLSIPATLKWPNDVLVQEKKIAGILIELYGAHAIVGIGVNVDQAPLPSATSLRAEGAPPVSRDRLLNAILYRFQCTDVRREYARLSATLGHRVRVEQIRGCIEGQAVDVDSQGYLLVDEGRAIRRVGYGDCVHLR
ncbi:MAG: biotin--[acetyl-CoA-carboxylase] ligase [Candidatus Thermoplasmatota archaeon]|nr:biotin--[acetyl-CoA-carboxylase] ligase [Candidatus Thermoplasmatota archaeon]